jgi:crotonobetainyl-CoA:carnitine CoA-transferase CaiB-like acyl-CoA transferase
VDDPHVRAREMLVAVEHPGSERPVVTPNTPMRFAATPGGVYRRAPKLGEHTDEVFDELGADASA